MGGKRARTDCREQNQLQPRLFPSASDLQVSSAKEMSGLGPESFPQISLSVVGEHHVVPRQTWNGGRDRKRRRAPEGGNPHPYFGRKGFAKEGGKKERKKKAKKESRRFGAEAVWAGLFDTRQTRQFCGAYSTHYAFQWMAWPAIGQRGLDGLLMEGHQAGGRPAVGIRTEDSPVACRQFMSLPSSELCECVYVCVCVCWERVGNVAVSIVPPGLRPRWQVATAKGRRGQWLKQTTTQWKIKHPRGAASMKRRSGWHGVAFRVRAYLPACLPAIFSRYLYTISFVTN
ncbi:hypothetical protein LZ30DRAFT_122073 [Colletotrichum cereale]|nr:hypothetical protein LZ30DRAFT_122073 [Colletotrichum cereale]